MRKNSFAPDEYYHIYNRGVEKRNIFIDNNDRWRFLTALFLFQWKNFIPNIDRFTPRVRHLVSHSSLLEREEFKKLFTKRFVELVCFCLMPNHFHLILREIEAGGISYYMQRLGDSYTKYFNTKRERVGHLFGGVFQSVHIDHDEYLNYLSAYIHLNPRELKQWQGRETEYFWSSLQDFIGQNRWGHFIAPSIILDQFKNKEEYRAFLNEGDIKDSLDDRYLIDID